MRSPSEFQKSVQENELTHWPIHDCSLCHYPCGYIFNKDGNVFYDSGCDCVAYTNLQPRSWEDVAEHYNQQSNADYIKEMDTFWKFIKPE